MTKGTVTASRISKRMNQLALKQVDLANYTGSSKATISMWVNGDTKPNGENTLKLAQLLEVSPEWLLGSGEEDEHDLASVRHTRFEKQPPKLKPHFVNSLSDLGAVKAKELINYDNEVVNFFKLNVIPLFPEEADVICTKLDQSYEGLKKGDFIGINTSINEYDTNGLYVVERCSVGLEHLDSPTSANVLGKVIWHCALYS
ncbi:helix-turn-helix domain-containing protein [Photobacterium sp. R1]